MHYIFTCRHFLYHVTVWSMQFFHCAPDMDRLAFTSHIFYNIIHSHLFAVCYFSNVFSPCLLPFSPYSLRLLFSSELCSFSFPAPISTFLIKTNKQTKTCRGLSANNPNWCTCFNAWSPGGGTIWERLGCTVCRWG